MNDESYESWELRMTQEKAEAEKKEVIGWFVWFDLSQKAKIVDVVCQVIEGHPTLVYLTEGDFSEYLHRSRKYYYPTMKNNEGEYVVAFFGARIETEAEHEKYLEWLRNPESRKK